MAQSHIEYLKTRRQFFLNEAERYRIAIEVEEQEKAALAKARHGASRADVGTWEAPEPDAPVRRRRRTRNKMGALRNFVQQHADFSTAHRTAEIRRLSREAQKAGLKASVDSIRNAMYRLKHVESDVDPLPYALQYLRDHGPLLAKDWSAAVAKEYPKLVSGGHRWFNTRLAQAVGTGKAERHGKLYYFVSL